MLSKSKYLAGLQCELRVWNQVHAKDLAPPPDAATQALFDAGTEVGEHARGLFPGGVLVDEPAWRHSEAVRRTRRLVEGASGHSRIRSLIRESRPARVELLRGRSRCLIRERPSAPRCGWHARS